MSVLNFLLTFFPAILSVRIKKADIKHYGKSFPSDRVCDHEEKTENFGL